MPAGLKRWSTLFTLPTCHLFGWPAGLTLPLATLANAGRHTMFITLCLMVIAQYCQPESCAVTGTTAFASRYQRDGM